MANSNFAPRVSSDEIWRGTDIERCITDDLDAIEKDIDGIQKDTEGLLADVATVIGSSAAEVRKAIEIALFSQAPSLTNEQIMSVKNMWHDWEDGAHYTVGVIVDYLGGIYRCKEEHDASDSNNPYDTHNIWDKIESEENLIEARR